MKIKSKKKIKQNIPEPPKFKERLITSHGGLSWTKENNI